MMNSLNADPSSRLRLTTSEHVYGKYYAMQTLVSFVYHMSNWDEVWAAYRGRGSMPFLRLRNGMRLIHGPGDDAVFSFREMFLGKPYTPYSFYRPAADQTVIDIGANIGWFALFLQSRARGINVHCFEPGPPALKCLHANIDINELNEFVKAYPYAVTDRVGRAALANSKHSVERHILKSRDPAEGADVVETITFERALEMVGAETVDLVKIDVEGAEVEIVLGSDIKTWGGVKRVALEYHGYLRPGCRERLVRALSERGFKNIQVMPAKTSREQGIMLASRDN